MEITSETVNEIIKERQSLYIPQMKAGATIPDKKIWQLLENANYAPSHKRTEPWRYIVFSNESLHEFFIEMGKIYKKITPAKNFDEKKIIKFQQKAKVLSHLVAICMHRDEKERVPVQEEEYAVACSVQNILLSMKPLDIIGYWSTGKIAFSEEIKEYLELGEKDKCLGFLQLGVPKEGLPDLRKQQISSIKQKVIWR